MQKASAKRAHSGPLKKPELDPDPRASKASGENILIFATHRNATEGCFFSLSIKGNLATYSQRVKSVDMLGGEGG